jgi:hypothetical protein
MKWSVDTNKFMSEIVREGLKVLVNRHIGSDSGANEIAAAEDELAAVGFYQTPEAAKGRIKRSLFTYLKSYGILDDNLNLTELGQMFYADQLSVREMCLTFVCNYMFVDDITGEPYFPLELILRYMAELHASHPGAVYLTRTDFDSLCSCHAAADVSSSFVTASLELRGGTPPSESDRTVGFDVWSRLLKDSGLFSDQRDANLRPVNLPLHEWLLKSYSEVGSAEKGKLFTGVFEHVPLVQTVQVDDLDVQQLCRKCVRAFLFDGLEIELIDKYVNDDSAARFGQQLKELRLSEDSRAYYKDFVGYEHVVASALLHSAFRSHQAIAKLVLNLGTSPAPAVRDALPHNLIVFGAPGTGKSYQVAKHSSRFGVNLERVTFHPDYSYAQFVGTYKPVAIGDNITYKYVPGPFTRVLVKALKNPGEDYLLIIEEINRANVAATFGDVFQLLDRKDGASEFPIAASEDLRAYLEEQLERTCEDVAIPSNMYVWATMNSADQGVFPMDTAFKRRWDFRYIGIDDGSESLPQGVGITDPAGHTVEWDTIRRAINATLVRECRVNEDKLLGCFYLGPSKLKDSSTFNEAFKSKVLMYLYEDAARQHRKDLFKGCDSSMYSSVCSAYDHDGMGIFAFSGTAESDTVQESSQ